MKKYFVWHWKRFISLAMAVVMLGTMCPGDALEAEASQKALSGPSFAELICEEQKASVVTWDCVYFGSYPQAEVISTELRRNYTAFEFTDEEEFVESDSLYARLQNAEWNDRNETVVDGVRYRRMQKKDAVWAYEENGNISSLTGEDGKYQWSDDISWHYFRYEPIKWRVLDCDGSQAFLVADQVLDVRPWTLWSEKYENDSPWGDSAMRGWLNGYVSVREGESYDYRQDNFMNSAFTQEEQMMICDSDLKNVENSDVITDKIFLLSKDETEKEAYGFVSDFFEAECHYCESSCYAKAMGVTFANLGNSTRVDINGNSRWWIRATIYDSAGVYNTFGDMKYVRDTEEKRYGVRPALRLDLSDSSVYNWAGTVSNMKEVTKPALTEGGSSDLSNPQSAEDSTMNAGRNVTWDCVYLGSYPQAEVITRDMSREYEALQNLTLEKGDVYISDTVYQALTSASESDWDNNEIMLDGEKYRRIKKEDTGLSMGFGSAGYYNWAGDSWHYFKYEPIKWRVLQTSDSKAYLVSDRILDYQIYNGEKYTPYNRSIVRSWLNGYCKEKNYAARDFTTERNFIDSAFSVKEQDAILNVVKKSWNYYPFTLDSGTEVERITWGPTVADKVKLLSDWDVSGTDEAETYGFSRDRTVGDEGRMCKGSLYAKAMGLDSSAEWYLATANSGSPYSVQGTGVFAAELSNYWNGVRPAVWLDLSASDCYMDAGTVSSKETESGSVMSGICGENADWKFYEETGELVISGTGPMYDYESISDLPWSALRKEGKVVKITVKDGVTRIGKQAFRSMANTIGPYWEDSLEETEISDSVKEIGDYAFYNCNVLKSVTIPDAVEKIGIGAFYCCEQMTDLAIGNGIKTVGTAAFAKSGITSLLLPDSVTSLGAEQSGSGNTDADSAISALMEYGGVCYSCPNLKHVRLPSALSEISEQMFANCTSLTEITIPDSVTSIGDFAFSECKALQNMNLSAGIKEIGEYGFYRCGFTQAELPGTVTSLGRSCFSETNITEITIPDSVTKLGDSTFSGCAALSSVKIGKRVSELPVYLFKNCQKLTTITLSEGLKKISSDIQKNGDPMSPFTGCSALKEIIIPQSVKSMGCYTFADCTALENVKFLGYAPVFEKDGSSCLAFQNVEADVYYPEGDASWSADIRQSYGGLLTWIPYKKTETNRVSQFTYKFGNTKSDFGYEEDYKIDEESIFTKLWGNTVLAKDRHDYWSEVVGKWEGNCYGMSATSIMFNDNRDDIEISGFNSKASLVKDLELNDYNRNSNIRMSLLDFIEIMQVSQVDDTVSTLIRQTNRGKINRLCSTMKSAEEDNAAIIIVLDNSGPLEKCLMPHAVVGYHMEDVSETERRIYIYDCNYPNENRYITLTMENGTCTGWYYDGGNESRSMIWTSEKIDDVTGVISFISYDSFVKVWLNRTLESKPASGKNVMTLNVDNAAICDKDGQEVAVLEDGEIISENEDIYAYYPIGATLDGNSNKSEMQPIIYLPTDEYVVKNTDTKVDELKLSMCNVDRKLEIVTSAASVTVNVNDASKVNMVQVEGEEEKVEANFYSSDNAEQYKTLNFIGSIIGSSPMLLGSSSGTKVVENLNITSEKVENKEPGTEEKPADKEEKPADKEEKPADKEEKPADKEEKPADKEEKPADKEEKPADKEENPTNKEEKPADFSFKITSSTGSSKIAAGKKIKLTVTITSKNIGKPKLSYSSSNKKIAAVNQKGVVSIKKNAGGKSVVITAVNEAGRKASVKLKIMKGAVKKIKITGKKTCKAGKSLKLKAKVTAGKGANKSVVWKSSNTKYAEVTRNGTVKTKKKGKGKKVKITVTATDGSGKKGSVMIAIK